MIIDQIYKNLLEIWQKNKLSIANILYGIKKNTIYSLLLFIKAIYKQSQNQNIEVKLDEIIKTVATINSKNNLANEENLIHEIKKLENILDIKIFNTLTMLDVRLIYKYISTFSWKQNKIIIINADSLQVSCANAILKLLETQTQENIYFFFLSSNLDKILPTIKSRCIVYSANDFNNTNNISQYNLTIEILDQTLEYNDAIKNISFFDIIENINIFINKILILKKIKNVNLISDIISGNNLLESEIDLLQKINIDNLTHTYFYINAQIKYLAIFNLDEKSLFNLIKYKLFK